ncbi:MAG: PD40 domain-containing protein [Chloroflexi bacterium]|nr:PD40 domain-containing protein [Chloroflexota bacterium]
MRPYRAIVGITLCALVALIAFGSVYWTNTTATAASSIVNGKIAFMGEGPSAVSDIFAVDPDGTGLTNLTDSDTTSDGSPVWSPDGTKIAFSSWAGGTGEIFVMHADGSGRTQLTSNAEVSYQAPDWSPDGSRIVLQSWDGATSEIYVVHADGSGETRLTTNEALDAHPAWSPDGTKIAFTSDRDGNFDIYVMHADGSGQTNLTNALTYEDAPDWSPDGSKIAFRSDRDGFGNVYVMNHDGGEQTRLTDDPMFDGQPSWSPDGSKIAFVSYRDRLSHDIYVMNADGSEQTRLTNTSGAEFGPDWQPLCEKECPEPTSTPTPKPEEPTPTPKPEEPTPTPAPEEPTATPKPEEPVGPGMRLNVTGGTCDHPTAPSICHIPFGGSFLLSVEVVTAPEAGYILAQTFIDFGGHLAYKPAASAANEIIWPDLADGTALRSQGGAGLVNHGGLTSLTPPMPVSHFEGAIVQLEMSCSAEASSNTVLLLAADEKEVGTKGSLFVLPDATQIVPAVSGLTVACVAPEMVLSDTDGDGCSDLRENGSDESMGGLRDYLNSNDFYDVLGGGGGPPDQIIDLSNDIFGVIIHYAPTGTEPEYDVDFDRGPSAGPNPWNMTAPDGVIDLSNDIMGVIQQYQHDCR